MSAYVDTHRQLPSRSPLRESLPSHPQQPQAHSQASRLQPLTKIVPDQRRQSQYLSHPSHSHTRTASSSTLPSGSSGTAAMPPSQQYNGMAPNNSQTQYQQYPAQYPATTRRTLSNGTTSTTSTNGGNRKPSLAGSTLHRTTSSRSGSSPTSYVALMRKQKATVWSDRAQHEDPRLQAQQRAAKMRAHMEVSGAHPHSGRISTSGNSSITGGVRSKIRGHTAPKAQQYAPTTNPASGVPMRLSAREVDEDDDPDDQIAQRNAQHRSGSGRSSIGSNNGRVTSMYGPGTARSSEGNTPPQISGQSAPPPPMMEHGEYQQRGRADTQGSVPSTTAEPTPVPGQFRSGDYFATQGAHAQGTPGSDNSEREDSFGNVAALPHRVREVEEKKDDDLQRRGSVDERTTTMRGYGRLFVANPDLSD